MSFGTLASAGTTQWMIAHGYVLMFIAMCIEGPAVTLAAAAAAALGYFNPFIVLALSILGDLLPDAVFYVIGFYGRLPFVERLGRRWGLPSERIAELESLIQRNEFKVVLAAKFTPVIPVIGLMLIGAVRMAFGRFMGLCLLISGARSVAVVFIGYEFAWALGAVKQSMGDLTLAGTVLLLIALAVFLYRIIADRISRPADGLH